MFAFDVLVERASGVFKRNKVDVVKVLAALLYFSGLSYRRVLRSEAFLTNLLGSGIML
jgi:hypothetical protein